MTIALALTIYLTIGAIWAACLVYAVATDEGDLIRTAGAALILALTALFAAVFWPVMLIDFAYYVFKHGWDK